MSEEFPFKPGSNPDIFATNHLLPTPEQAEPLRSGEADPKQAIIEAPRTIAESAQSELQPNPLEALQAAESAQSELQPNPLEALQAAEKAAQPDAPSPRFLNRELKLTNLRRELKEIRRSLPLSQRIFSHVIHQPAVRVASEAVGKTLSRPTGLLGGGLVAFLGTTGYLYLARHLGFTYNYLVFLILLAGGFILGLVIEMFIHLTPRFHRNSTD